MAGSGPTAHCTVRAGPGCGAMGREGDKGQKATLSMFLSLTTVSAPVGGTLLGNKQQAQTSECNTSTRAG